MNVYTLSGPPPRRAQKVDYLTKLQKRLSQINPRSFAAHLIRNEIYRLTGKAAKVTTSKSIPDYRTFLLGMQTRWTGKGIIPKLIQKELDMISRGQFQGNVAMHIEGIGFLKKLRKKLKKVTLKKILKAPGKALKEVAKAPKNIIKEAGKLGQKAIDAVKMVALTHARNAFLILVKLNFRGLASVLTKAPESEVTKKWKRVGGQSSKLLTAMRQGRTKTPLLGGSQKAIKGIGQRSAIGAEPTTLSTGAILAAAAPVLGVFAALIAKWAKVKKFPGANGNQVEGADSDIISKTLELAEQLGGNSFLPGGFVADQDPGSSPDAGQPDDDNEPDSGSKFDINPVVLVGVTAGGLYLLSKK